MKLKQYSRQFQQMAVERMRTCEDVGQLAQEAGVTRRCLYKWRAELDLVESGKESARLGTHGSTYRKQAPQEKQLLTPKVLEVDFLRLRPHLGHKTRRIPCCTVMLSVGKDNTSQQHARF